MQKLHEPVDLCTLQWPRDEGYVILLLAIEHGVAHHPLATEDPGGGATGAPATRALAEAEP